MMYRKTRHTRPRMRVVMLVLVMSLSTALTLFEMREVRQCLNAENPDLELDTKLGI